MSILHAALKEQLAELTTKHKVDPFSREFIFGGNATYARLRNQPFALGPNGRMPLLRAMFRYGLDETRRANVFPSPYHLGSSKSIPQRQLSLVDLAKKVRKEKQANRKEGGAWDDPETLKKEFESITGGLKAITGTTFSNYEDKQNALRLIYLIDRMMPSSGFDEERGTRLLTFIKTPTTRFSFEARDAYPITESEGNTFLLNDLKAYIAIEIDNETQDRIDSVFYPLINRLDDIRSHLDQAAYSSGQKSRIVTDYKSIGTMVEAIDVSGLTAARRRPARLDVDLYLHLSRFELLHFSGAHAEVLDAARPPSPITSIRGEMIEALSTLKAGARSYYDTTQNNFCLDGLPVLANNNADLFLDLISKALGFRPTKPKYERSVSLANELLYRSRLFGAATFSLSEPVKVNFRSIVAALCATSQALEHPTRYRPRVFGDDSQTRSIITPLEYHISIDGKRPSKEIPEGYLQIWHNRREWVQDALEGADEIAELKFSLRSLLWAKVVECVQHSDIAVIEENLSKLEVCLLSVRPDVLRA